VNGGGAMDTATMIAFDDQETFDSEWRRKAAPTRHFECLGSEQELNFGAIHVVVGEQTLQPRHRHVQEQLRYMFSGSMTYGRNQTVREGEFVYFPESVPYGPVTHEPGEMLVLQWPGPSELGNWLPHQKLVPASLEMLKNGGTFDKSKGGIFRYPDGRQQDGHEAIAEYIKGEKVVYSPPRYADNVCIRPALFPAFEVQDSPGVRIKHIAYFNEVGPNIKILQFDAGASLPPSTVNSQQIWDVLSGKISYAGESYSRKSFLYSAPRVKREQVVAEEPTEILVVHLRRQNMPLIPFSEF
jgi:quercetin dioxygenase-like cupin family protein